MKIMVAYISLAYVSLVSAYYIDHIAIRDSYSLTNGQYYYNNVYLYPGNAYYGFMVCDQNNNNDCTVTTCSGTIKYTVTDPVGTQVATATVTGCDSGLKFNPTVAQYYTVTVTCQSAGGCTSNGKNLDVCRYYSTPLSALPAFKATFTNAVSFGFDGSVSFSYAADGSLSFGMIISSSFNYTGVCDTTQGFQYHVHYGWNYPSGATAAVGAAACSPPYLQGHFGAWSISHPNVTYNTCNSTSYAAKGLAVCELGDLSGKFGKVYPTPIADTTGFFLQLPSGFVRDVHPPDASDMLSGSLAFTLHCASTGARLACAEITTVSAPTSSPVQRPSGGSSSSGSCFAGSETVESEYGKVPINQIKVGDSVLTADRDGNFAFSKVIFVPHGPNDRLHSFVQLHTASGLDLKLTADHIIVAGGCSDQRLALLPVDTLELGMCVVTKQGREPIVEVKQTIGSGLYTLVTEAEFLVVNGIIVSPFAFNHKAAHAYYTAVRFLGAANFQFQILDKLASAFTSFLNRCFL